MISHVFGRAPVESLSTDEPVESLSGTWAHRHNSDSDGTPSQLSPGELPSPGEPTAPFQIGLAELEVLTNIMNEFDPCHESSSPKQVRRLLSGSRTFLFAPLAVMPFWHIL